MFKATFCDRNAALEEIGASSGFQLRRARTARGESDVGGQQQWAAARCAPQMIANRRVAGRAVALNPLVHARVAFFTVTDRPAAPRTRPLAFRCLGTFSFDEGRQHCLRYWRNLGNDTCQYLSQLPIHLYPSPFASPGYPAHVHAVGIPSTCVYKSK